MCVKALKMSCTVCDAKFTVMKRKEIKCVFCQYTYCRDCLQNYLMSGENKNNCMNCSRLLTMEFIEANTSKVFMEKYKQKMFEEVVFRREKDLIPVTTELAGYIKEGIYKLAKQATISLNMFESGGEVINKNFINCSEVGCKGYVCEKNGWICTICKKITCHKCLCIINPDISHSCDETIIASLELIKTTSKECPTCKISINRVSGCSQMFCINCRTVFDWNTGKIDTGIIHNPHFYIMEREERMRRRREPVEDICYYNVDYWDMQIRLLKSGYEGLEKDLRCVVDTYFIIKNYIKNFTSIRKNIKTELNEFQQLRIKYILNDINEEDWKNMLLKLERREKEYESIRNIYDTLCERILVYMVNSIKYFHRNMNSTTPSSDVAMNIYENLRSKCAELITEANSYVPKKYNIVSV